MQFLHVLTAKTLLKNPMQFTGISLVWSYHCFRGDRWCNLRLKRLKAGPGDKLKS
jgi:hypothetical protein